MDSNVVSFGSPEIPNGQDAPASPKKRALSVSAAVRLTKTLLAEHTFCIEGEVSELNNKPGYKAVYFTIKDEDASLSCLMWKSRFQASGVPLRIGAKVQVTGKFTIFAPKGRMNFDVSRLVLAGEGDLRQKVAQLAAKLKQEGLMDETRKRSLPGYPRCIGLVTSPRGAAVHDVLRTLRRRYPLARIAFAGVPVEGANAARDLSAALQKVAQTDAEVVLLVRGGGSFEDLMPFNDEGLARTIANCKKPVVTGIGHEPDTSIADMVADMRASTPTAAAEAVSPHFDELNESIEALKARMEGSLSHRLHRSVVYLDAIASRPLFKDPTSLFAGDLQTTDALQDRLERVGRGMVPPHQDKLCALAQRFEGALPRKLSQMETEMNALAGSLKRSGSSLLANQTHQASLANASLVRLGKTLLSQPVSEAAVVTARLNDLSPLRTLERGWSIARSDQGALIKSVSDVKPNDAFTLQLIDGALACRVEDEAVSELDNIITMEESHD